MKSRNRSLPMLVTSMVIFGSIGVFRRFIPLSSAALACFRGFCGAFFLLVLALFQKRKVVNHIGINNIIWLIISGAVMGANWILLFEAYNYTTVATATLCYYMEPTIVVVLSPWLFGEKMGIKKWICVVTAFVGMIFISGIVQNGAPNISDYKGVLYGLAAAMLYSTVVIMNKLRSGFDAYEKTIIQLFSAAIVILPYVMISRVITTGELTVTGTVMLLIVGFVHTGIAYGMYFGCMDGLKATTVAILSYLDPVVALVLSAVVLKERLDVWGIIGAVMILGAALCLEYNPKPAKN